MVTIPNSINIVQGAPKADQIAWQIAEQKFECSSCGRREARSVPRGECNRGKVRSIGLMEGVLTGHVRHNTGG